MSDIKYYLQEYLYNGNPEILEEIGDKAVLKEWSRWHYAVLMEVSRSFFDRYPEAQHAVADELCRKFYFLALNARQGLFLFEDVHCDYRLVVSQIRQILLRRYAEKYFFAISRRFDGYTALPAIMAELESQMEERFYHPERIIYTAEEESALTVFSETQDSLLIERISEDVSRKDVDSLWRHFGYLKEKFTRNTQYSSMYVKFVFSSVIQELFSEEQFAEKRDVSKAVTRLYQASELLGIIGITEDCIREYERFIQDSAEELRDEVMFAAEFIDAHCTEEISPETLAEKVNLSPGYLSFAFKRETGMSIARYTEVQRMNQASSGA